MKNFLAMHDIDENGCWNYHGNAGTQGYGQIKQTTAHRWHYQQLVGSIPDDLEVDHLCRNKKCVNPDHLEPVTAAENTARKYQKPGHCRNGHQIKGKSMTVLERGNPAYPCTTCDETAALNRAAWGRLFAAFASSERP